VWCQQAQEQNLVQFCKYRKIKGHRSCDCASLDLVTHTALAVTVRQEVASCMKSICLNVLCPCFRFRLSHPRSHGACLSSTSPPPPKLSDGLLYSMRCPDGPKILDRYPPYFLPLTPPGFPPPRLAQHFRVRSKSKRSRSTSVELAIVFSVVKFLHVNREPQHGDGG
jgi:hypothetical protein